jgi:hypothetical protein
MSRISSNNLFNFTDNINYLISNLQNGIYCSINYERLPLTNNGYKAPMCCFCDIPLSLIHEHFKWYGRYGIGIKRNYARELGVKPVWYITSENNFIKNISKDKKISEYQRKYVIPYLKQFIGHQLNQKGKNVRKKFYDEREWRYISDTKLVEPLFGKQLTDKQKQPMSANKRMKIDLTAVEYIFVDNENEVERIIKELKIISIGKIKYEYLISKILTAKKIETDF